MSNVSVSFDDDDVLDEPAVPEVADLPSEPVTPRAPRGSLLGQLEQAVDNEVANDTKVLPVGKIPRLRARYRALLDHEQAAIEQKVRARSKQRQKTGEAEDTDTERQNDSCALLLATACVELLWVTDDGNEVPLHELLAGPDEMGDDAPSGPLRFDRASIDLVSSARAASLRERLGRELNAVDVVRELHRWGTGENYSPLRAYGKLLNLWMSGASAAALAEVSQGN